MSVDKYAPTTEKGADANVYDDDLAPVQTNGGNSVNIGHVDNADQLQRHLGNRQIQLIAIGGSIGTATFVSITSGFVKGGPGSLFLAYTIYACMLGLCNNGMAEMACYMPVSGSFIRMAGHWVDEAFGFMGKIRTGSRQTIYFSNRCNSWVELSTL